MSISLHPLMNNKSEDWASSAADQLLDLPQHLLHHILSFLQTKDVVKTSILSKTFMSIANTIPVLDFDFDFESAHLHQHEFLSYINSTLHGRSQKEQEAVLHKFRVSLEDGDLFMDHCIDDAISYAARNNAKELVLVVPDGFPLPATAFYKSLRRLYLSCYNVENLNELILGSPQLEKLELDNCSGLQDFNLSSKNIKYIDLGCLDLKTINIESSSLEFFRCSCMPSYFDFSKCIFLKVMSLRFTTITDNWIKTVVPQLVLLETMELYNCDELNTLKVFNNNLKQINIRCCQRLEIIQVQVNNLESFEFDTGCLNNRFTDATPSIREINISSCKHLKNLKLSGSGLPKDVLQEQVMKLLELDSLELDLSPFSGRIEIDHKNLKKLHIYTLPGEHLNHREIRIHTPSLVSFHYKCEVIPLLSFHYEATALHATVYINPYTMNTHFFLRWYEFIRHFGHCKILTIDCHEELTFPHDLREKLTPPLVHLKHMRIKVMRITTELVDSLLWLSPYLETLVFICPWSSLSLKFEYGRTNKEQDALCYPDHPIEYYSFTTVEMSFDDIGDKNNLLKLFKEKSKSIRSISCKRICSFNSFYLVA